MPKTENKFQPLLMQEIESRLPGCVLLKNDEQYMPGVPDLLILYKNKWAMLEVKRSAKERSDPEPNQEWYVDMFDRMSFAAFIYPENKDEILDALQSALQPRRKTRIPIR